MSKTKHVGWLATGWILAGMLMGMHGSCAPKECPQGSFLDEDQACWTQFNTAKWHTINRGELKVRLHHSFPTQKNKVETQAYRFVFIQDPKEAYIGSKKGRFGHWKIQVEHHPHTPKTHTMTLRWRLRDVPASLKQKQTIRLIATWNESGVRKYQTLLGHYFDKDRSVQAVLPQKLQTKPTLWLFPARQSHTESRLQRTALLTPSL